MQKFLDSLVDGGATGVLLHYRDDNARWVGSSGRTDLDTGRPVDPESWFRAGSITKTFTAVVVLQLVSEGLLQLDEPVTRWLPEVPESVTLRQLLNHTSGLYNYTDDLPDVAGIVRDRYKQHNPRATLAAGLGKPRLFDPGSSWSYSNTNYIALGLLIEAVTGHPYAEEVRTRILQPIGLERTMLPGHEVTLPEPHVHSYLSVDGELVDLAQMNASTAWAAGELVSTAADLNRFYAALLSGELLGEPELAAMLTTVPNGDASAYGLGIERRDLPGGLALWGHRGGIFGYLTLSYHSADLSHQLSLSSTGNDEPSPETEQLLAGLFG